ncbi:branched-chain amino acid ABC transporter substrate-binding protein [Actinokineospora iranica]|uniref:branched-chain amino acid ABC transporter substrate-binding protein n=1 Tax=Actinokineospora iranica TaxID=1271860 RepID=UPI001E4B05F2|nr:branched-chain amino acid ABC transporter substrate-binding protein [Actinokineospora iranica]
MRNQTVKAAVLVAGALLLAACGTNKTESGAGGGNQACDVSKGKLVVGVIAPLSGELSALGLGIKNAADLAVREANKKCTVKGYQLVLDAQDDQKNPQLGAQAATKLSQDPNIVGIVGTLNSSVAQSVQPILQPKRIVQVSPANTSDALTKGDAFATAPARKFDNYFRTCTVDSLQGPFAANYMVEKLGKKNIAIVTDGLTYGEGLADAFTKQAEKLGAKIVTRQKIGEKDSEFSGAIGVISPFKPDAVFFGGQYPQAGPLSKQLKDAGLDVPVMGGDGIYDDKFMALGGKEGDLATSVGAPTESLESAKTFVEAYKAEGYKEPFSAYGAFSYDAANAIINSLETALKGGDWSESKREDLIKAVGAYQAQGATGEIAFDEFGDSRNKVLTVYRVSGGKWDPAETGTFSG